MDVTCWFTGTVTVCVFICGPACDTGPSTMTSPDSVTCCERGVVPTSTSCLAGKYNYEFNELFHSLCFLCKSIFTLKMFIIQF